MPSIFEENLHEEDKIAQSAIGQNIVHITPYQQIVNLSLIGNGNGEITIPHLVKEITVDDEVKYTADTRKEKVLESFSNSGKENIRNMMYKVTSEEYGTAYWRKLNDIDDDFEFYAKTGTADINGEIELNYAWFIGYAKNKNTDQKFYFASVFPYTRGEGSSLPGNVVKDFFTKYFKK